MKIILNDTESEEIEIIVNGKLKNQKVLKIVEALRSVDFQDKIILKKDDKTIIKEINEIEYFESDKNNVYAISNKVRYNVKFKLYEVETFSSNEFVRISKSCVVNITFIDHIEKEFSGNYLIITKNKDKLIMSRSYFNTFKKVIEKGE